MTIKTMIGDELRKHLTRKGLFVRTPINSKLKELEPEIALGRAILDRAMVDSFDLSNEAHWFDLDNDDFQSICFISYLEPEKVLEQYTIIKTRITLVSSLNSTVENTNQ